MELLLSRPPCPAAGSQSAPANAGGQRQALTTRWRDAEVQTYQAASTPWIGAGVSHCPQKGSSECGFVGRASPAPVVPLLFHPPLTRNRKIPAFNTKHHQQAEVLLPGRCPGPATHNHTFFALPQLCMEPLFAQQSGGTSDGKHGDAIS